MSVKKKRVFITGIAGFIGMHVALALRARGDEVIGCDNFNAFYDPALKRARQQQLEEVGVEVIEKDLSKIAELEEKILSCTHFIHLAAQAGVRSSVDRPRQVITDNISGLIEILEILKSGSIELIFASSSSVYGLNEKIPFSESDPCTRQVSLYGASKMAGELICHSYHHLYQIPMRLLRFFTVYGPWGRPDMAYFLFAKAIMEDKPIDVFNNGNMKRDFTYIDDIVDGILAAVDANLKFEIFNLGRGETEELGSLIQYLENALEKKAIRNMLPMQMGDVTHTFANIEKSKKLLGFQPKVSLEEGLLRFASWYKEQLIASTLLTSSSES